MIHTWKNCRVFETSLFPPNHTKEWEVEGLVDHTGVFLPPCKETGASRVLKKISIACVSCVCLFCAQYILLYLWILWVFLPIFVMLFGIVCVVFSNEIRFLFSASIAEADRMKKRHFMSVYLVLVFLF